MVNFYTTREIASDNNLIRQVEESGTIRKCSHCGYYVSVDDFASEYHSSVKNEVFYETCSTCAQKIDKGETIVLLECEDLEDYLDEEDSFVEYNEMYL